MERGIAVLLIVIVVIIALSVTSSESIFSDVIDLSPKHNSFTKNVVDDSCAAFRVALDQKDSDAALSYFSTCDRADDIVEELYGAAGDACGDVTGDGIVDFDDLLAVLSGWGDECTIGETEINCVDRDRDGFGDPGHPENECPEDNCPTLANVAQKDRDGDGIGDACELFMKVPYDETIMSGWPPETHFEYAEFNPVGDLDGDGIFNLEDNCASIFNPLQEDANNDGAGDVCDYTIRFYQSGEIFYEVNEEGYFPGNLWQMAKDQCQADADAVGLEGEMYPWLGDSTHDPIDYLLLTSGERLDWQNPAAYWTRHWTAPDPPHTIEEDWKDLLDPWNGLPYNIWRYAIYDTLQIFVGQLTDYPTGTTARGYTIKEFTCDSWTNPWGTYIAGTNRGAIPDTFNAIFSNWHGCMELFGGPDHSLRVICFQDPLGEMTECRDGEDNDGDGLHDPFDPGCWDIPGDQNSYNLFLDNEGSS